MSGAGACLFRSRKAGALLEGGVGEGISDARFVKEPFF